MQQDASALRQPKGLVLLFFTELWERFGFYTLQTILVLYMTDALLYPDEQTYLIFGAFSSLLYLTPTIGGLLADRLIGFRRAVFVGGALFIIGYVLLALPHEQAFFWGLSTVVIAGGFFKPNVSSMVGSLYRPDDPRRDSGFTLFYMGINIGALIPPLIMGTLVIRYGWHFGFLLAALGMSAGMITLSLGSGSGPLERFLQRALLPKARGQGGSFIPCWALASCAPSWSCASFFIFPNRQALS